MLLQGLIVEVRWDRLGVSKALGDQQIAAITQFDQAVGPFCITSVNDCFARCFQSKCISMRTVTMFDQAAGNLKGSMF